MSCRSFSWYSNNAICSLPENFYTLELYPQISAIEFDILDIQSWQRAQCLSCRLWSPGSNREREWAKLDQLHVSHRRGLLHTDLRACCCHFFQFVKANTCRFLHLHSFTYLIIEHPRCARHCARSWECDSEHNQQNSTPSQSLCSHQQSEVWDSTEQAPPTVEIPSAVWTGGVPGPTYVLAREGPLLPHVQPSSLPSCKTIQKCLREPRPASLPL